MRKINTNRFNRATRRTPREINRTIALNLVREHQPISRADLARRMEVGRGMVTLLIDELIAEGTIIEGEVAATPRGRKPRLLHVRTRDRLVVAVDVRFSRTFVMLSDFDGEQLGVESFPTSTKPGELVAELAVRIRRLLRTHGVERCEGIGMVVPGMVDRRTGRLLNSPQLGWSDVALREELQAATGIRVFLENAPIACALAQMWLTPFSRETNDSFVYVAVSDGVGAGVVVNGEVLRGSGDTAGEFGHVPLDVDGPLCMCGRRGCWEAYTSNVATLARYLGVDVSEPGSLDRLRASEVTVQDVVTRARAGDLRARFALEETGRYLGLGLALIVNILNPARILVGGEVTAAWELLEPRIRAAVRERTLTPAAASTPILAHDAGAVPPRLRGATALLVARSFAAPRVA